MAEEKRKPEKYLLHFGKNADGYNAGDEASFHERQAAGLLKKQLAYPCETKKFEEAGTLPDVVHTAKACRAFAKSLGLTSAEMTEVADEEKATKEADGDKDKDKKGKGKLF